MFLGTCMILGQTPPKTTKKVFKTILVPTGIPESKTGVQQALMDTALKYYSAIDSLNYDLQAKYEVLINQQRLLTELE